MDAERIATMLEKAITLLKSKTDPIALTRARSASQASLSSSSSSSEDGGDSKLSDLASEVLLLAEAVTSGEEKASLYAAELERSRAAYELQLEEAYSRLEEAYARLGAQDELKAQIAQLDAAKQEAEEWQPAQLASSLGSYVWNVGAGVFEVVSSATSQITTNRRSRAGVYSVLESEQMRTIHEYYARYLSRFLPREGGESGGRNGGNGGDGGDSGNGGSSNSLGSNLGNLGSLGNGSGSGIPDILAVTGDDFASSAAGSTPKPRSFHIRAWQHRVGDGPLRGLSLEILGVVCSYQVERHTRIAGSGYPDDPTNLLLAELKEWVVDSLSVAGVDDGPALDELRSRIKYVRDLINADIFPVGKSSSLHLVTVLSLVLALLHKANDAFSQQAEDAATVVLSSTPISVPIPPPPSSSPLSSSPLFNDQS